MAIIEGLSIREEIDVLNMLVFGGDSINTIKAVAKGTLLGQINFMQEISRKQNDCSNSFEEIKEEFKKINKEFKKIKDKLNEISEVINNG